ncbi:MAG TPA: ATP-binding protein [Xanthobacteraceae bacterium]|nr:ATP-binding protein [Xanthobacteraceae bacterium]
MEENENKYKYLFQFVPIPLVRLDRTELAGVFRTMAASGVRDFSAHIDAHPGFVRDAMHSIKIVETNRQALQLLGAHDPSEIHGSVARLWSESPEVFVRSMRARYEGALRFESEIKIRTLDGRIRNILYVTDFPEGFSNEALGLACLFDITDRVQAQEMLHRVQSEFAHAARISLLGELTASIAHEVNQPLASISAAGEASLRWLNRPQPELSECRQLIDHMIADAQRAAGIIARIRSMATPIPSDREPLALVQAIKEALSFLQHEIKKNRVQTELDFEVESVTVNADRIQLQQVVVNLVVNAIQAMSDPEIQHRRLVIRVASTDDNKARIEIEDSGRGIPPEKTGSLFESFYTTKPGGLGIGLPISRSIIEAHGGQLIAANRLDGSGAVFRFTLPLGKSKSTSKDPA